MSLGSRLLIRGKAAVNASLTSTPREPLLFLYPQWNRKTSSASSPHERRHNGSVLSDNRGKGACSIQTEVKKPLGKCAGSSATSPIENTDLPGHIQHGAAASGLNRNAAEHYCTNGGGRQQVAATAEVGINEEQLRATDFSIISTNSSRKPTRAESKRLVKRFRKIQSTIRYLEERKEVNLERRKQYHEEQRIRRGADLPDWRVILATLIENTPDAGQWLNKPVRVIVSSQEYDNLITGIDNTIWDVMSRHGCSITYRNKGPEVPANLIHFDLSGPINGIRAAVRDLLTVAPTTLIVANKATDRNPSDTAAEYRDSSSPPVRKSWVEKRHTITLGTHAAKVEKPEVWTQQSFRDYVGYLTSVKMPNHTHSLIYKDGESHIDVVSDILLRLFADRGAQHAFSQSAFNAAMQYLVKNNRILHARSIFVHMEMINFRMSTHTFNIMLRAAAQNNDLSNFHTILNIMLKQKYTPDSQTFLAFIRAFNDIRIKKYIISAMEKKNLLNHKSTVKQVCAQIVADEFEAYLQDNKTEREFLEYMDNQYGKLWLNVDSSNRILHILGSRWLISRSWKFVLEMKNRNLEPDNVSLNTILFHCKNMNNLEGAVEIIKNWPKDAQNGLSMDEDTYRCLFIMAWRLRMYNVARLVWKHACVTGSTTVSMRSLVYNSMKDAVGLQMAPTRAERRQRRQGTTLRVKEAIDPSETQQTILQMLALTSEKGAKNATKLGEALLPKVQEPTTQETAFNKGAIKPKKEVTNPNSVAKMFNRTAGVFISGITDISKHPVQRASETAPPDSARDLHSLVDIMRSTLNTVHLSERTPRDSRGPTRSDMIWFLREQLSRDRAMYLEWEPVGDFKKLLSAAYEKDMGWRKADVYENARRLDWMCERQTGLLVRRKDDRSKRVMWL